MEILTQGFVTKGCGLQFGTDNTFSATTLEKVIGKIVARHCGKVDAMIIDEKDKGDGSKV